MLHGKLPVHTGPLLPCKFLLYGALYVWPLSHDDGHAPLSLVWMSPADSVCWCTCADGRITAQPMHMLVSRSKFVMWQVTDTQDDAQQQLVCGASTLKIHTHVQLQIVSIAMNIPSKHIHVCPVHIRTCFGLVPMAGSGNLTARRRVGTCKRRHAVDSSHSACPCCKNGISVQHKSTGPGNQCGHHDVGATAICVVTCHKQLHAHARQRTAWIAQTAKR